MTTKTASINAAVVEQSAEYWLGVAQTVAQQFKETAVERDQKGGHAHEQRELLRKSGLLTLSILKQCGGAGQPLSLVYQIIRLLAQADSALAHILAFHYLQISSVLLYGSPAQADLLLRNTVLKSWFWGNALNPLDKRVIATERLEGGYVLHGDKGFCSGARGSDYLTVSGWHEATQSIVVAAVPTERQGITVLGDWDAMGQKQTDSGTVNFAHVVVEADEVLLQPGAEWSAAAHFRSCLAQLVLVNLYVGIAQGALMAAKGYTLEKAKPWFTSGALTSADDLYVQHHYGELWVKLRAAEVLTDLAVKIASTYFLRKPEITLDERGETAIAVAEAKVAAHHAVLEITTRLFDITGAGATKRDYGFDRFWRNARTHTLHDPLDYKLRDLGRWILRGEYPLPTSYS
jgi:alkylation response protein AidB-like acyl-CoA dehydrogenase